jgi:hypothetical protein
VGGRSERRSWPALKRILQRHGFFRSAEALLPPNKFAGCHLVHGLRRAGNLDDVFLGDFAQCLVAGRIYLFALLLDSWRGKLWIRI